MGLAKAVARLNEIANDLEHMSSPNDDTDHIRVVLAELTRLQEVERERDKLIEKWPDSHGVSGGREIDIWSGLNPEYHVTHPETGRERDFDDWTTAARWASGLDADLAEKCSTCDGTGEGDWEFDCKACGGTGWIEPITSQSAKGADNADHSRGR